MNEQTTTNNPFQPPKASVSEVPSETQELASLGARLAAALLDNLAIPFVLYIPMILVGAPALVLAAFRGQSMPEVTAAFGIAALVTLALVLAWLVITILWVARYGQTVGKRIIGIRVVRTNGEKAGIGRIFWLRNVVNALPTIIPIVRNFYWLVDALFVFSQSRRCIHDMIADTKVVKA